MKLIIDISEELYAKVPYLINKGNVFIGDVLDAVEKGTPLEAQPTDAVSRNEISRVLNTMDRYVADELTLCDTDKKYPKNEVFIVDDVYELIVEQLPSVTLERPKGKWIMNSDYPDRLICDKCNSQFDVWHWESKQMHFCPNCGAEMEVENE